jgi:geranylgeranyl reductase family protein
VVVYDAIVSGAGPAGAFAAYTCAQRGLKTVLLERRETDREKCCAGGVLDRSLRQLGFEIPGRVIEREITGVSIIHGDHRHLFPAGRRISVTVRRGEFDRFLAQKAEDQGAELWTNCEARKVMENEQGVTIATGRDEVSGKALIIAEGATSRSASQLFGPYPSQYLGMGMVSLCRFHNNPSDLLEFHILGEKKPRLQFEYPDSVNGWMFPHKNGGNVGVGALRVPTAALRSSLERVIERVAEENGGAVEVGRTRAHPIPVKPRRKMVSRRSLLVGDAAGLASPITGEGISYALTSGRLAAEAVSSMVLDGTKPSSLHSYQKELHGQVVSILSAARLITQPLQYVVDVIDIDRFMEAYHHEEGLFTTSVGMCTGEEEWPKLLKGAIKRFPQLFFSSL